MQRSRNLTLMGTGLLTMVLPSTCLFLSINILFFVPIVVGLGCIFVGNFWMTDEVKSRVTALGLTACFAAAIGPFALAAYANRSSRPIRIVLPAGFRGEFSIVKDHQKGQNLKLQDGAWEFEIPAEGVLVVNDDYPFYSWHQETFVYSDGRPAIVKGLGTLAGSIRTGPNSSSGSTDYDGTTHHWRVMDSP